MDSPEDAMNTSPVQESSYLNFVNNLSPIETVKTSPASQVFLGLNTPPLFVFTSARVDSQRLEISQSDNAVINSLDDDSKKLSCQIPKDFDFKNDALSAPLSVDDYLADHNLEEPGKLEGDSQEGQHSDTQGGMSRGCLQFEEGVPKDLNPPPAVALNLTSTKTEMLKLSLFPPQPLICSSSPCVGYHLNCPTNSMPHAAVASTNMRLADTCFGLQKVKFMAGNTEKFNQPRSPEMKKQKTSSNTGGHAYKQCTCKKSTCLKLYCDCFADRKYCDDNCACQHCCNRPPYEDYVAERRQQIESRNPLAFCPKIENVNQRTPSARHRRGCNCKRSKCSKKYCECYQANVGCSGVCRCEGCNNMYGKRKDYAAIGDALSQRRLSGRVEKGSDSELYSNMEVVTSPRNSFREEFHDLHHLPPSLQFPDRGQEAARSRSVSGRYLASPEAGGITMLQSEPIVSERSVISESNETLGSGTYGRQLDYNDMEMMNQASVKCNSVPSLHQRTVSYPSSIMSHANSRLLSGLPTTSFGGTRYSYHFGGVVYDIAEDQMLHEKALPLIKSEKSTTPNQRQVSPLNIHLREVGSNSSGHLTSNGVVKSIPSFPPASPYNGGSDGNDHEDSGTSTT